MSCCLYATYATWSVCSNVLLFLCHVPLGQFVQISCSLYATYATWLVRPHFFLSLCHMCHFASLSKFLFCLDHLQINTMNFLMFVTFSRLMIYPHKLKWACFLVVLNSFSVFSNFSENLTFLLERGRFRNTLYLYSKRLSALLISQWIFGSIPAYSQVNTDESGGLMLREGWKEREEGKKNTLTDTTETSSTRVQQKRYGIIRIFCWSAGDEGKKKRNKAALRSLTLSSPRLSNRP